MHIEQKLAFLKSCTEEPRSHYSQLTNSNPDLLKSCLYQINSLNQTILRQLPPFSQMYSESTNQLPFPQLPKINKQTSHSTEEYTVKTLLSKASILLNNSKIKPLNNTSLKTILEPQARHSQQLKEKKVRTRIIVRQPQFFLNKEQRYFQAQTVEVCEDKVKKIGLYESTNIFKAKNVAEHLNKLTIVAEKPQFNPIKLINKNDIFLTNIAMANNTFSLQTFIQEELNRDKQCEQVITKCDSIRMSNRCDLTEMKQILETHQQVSVTPIYITFKNYSVLQDEQYKLLKVKNLQNWGAILLNLSHFCSCLKYHKIMHFVVKEDKIVFWEGQKSTQKTIQDVLAIATNTTPQRVQRIVLAFRDKLKVAAMKRELQRKDCLARWVVQRLKTVVSLRKQKQEKVTKAMQIQQKLADQDFEPLVQVRIPSFSVQPFKRNTTQYMQSFEALYHALWEPTHLPLVLVLPTVNENLLKLLQNRIKIIRPVTIVTPQVHQLLPRNLALSAQVRFSYETLKKISKAICGRQAVIYGGIYDDAVNELFLSQYLNAPFYGSLVINNSVQQQKETFTRVGLKNPAFCIIEAKSTIQELLNKLAQLLLIEPEDKSWVFKMNGQFRGRGIATLRFNPLKHINSQHSKNSNLLSLKEILRSMLRLKLKVNFQNSLFMVQDYLTHFLQSGGVIQQLIEVNTTYELCFKKEAKCELLSVFKIYGISFANKIWLTAEKTPEISSLIINIQSELENRNFFGYVSVTLCKNKSNQFMGIDIKLGQTPPCSVTSFISMVQQKRMTVGSSNGINIVQLPTLRSQRNRISQNKTTENSSESSYRYLFIPTFPFTDVNQSTKAALIEDLMNECWADKRLKIGEEGRLYFSLGLDFSALVLSKQVKKLKKISIELVRQLTDRMSSLKQYRGKEVVRDVFQYGDVIRAISQIRNDD